MLENYNEKKMMSLMLKLKLARIPVERPVGGLKVRREFVTRRFKSPDAPL